MSAAGVVVGCLVAVGSTVLLNLAGAEVAARLQRLPVAIAGLAARRLPVRLRAEIHDEVWLPDLYHLLADGETGPLTRLVRATRYALSLWLRRGGARMAAELDAYAPPAFPGFEDVRGLPRARRREFDVRAARLRAILRDSGDLLDTDATARLLDAAAVVCAAYTDDRDERAAESLARAAGPLAARLEPDHPAVLGLRRARAAALLQSGRHVRAYAQLSALSADEARVFGPDSPGTWRTRRLLCWALVPAGRVDEAAAGLRALGAEMAAAPGAEPALRLHVRCMLAWVLSVQGRTRAAEDGYRRVAAERARRFGDTHADTLDTRHSLGKALVHSGQGRRAEQVLRPVLADRGRLLGARHPDTLETRKYLLVARETGGRAGRGTLLALRLIARAQSAARGPDHADTLDTRRWIAALGRARDPSGGPGSR